MKGLPGTPVILHCHVPKTAGITVSRRFAKSFDTLHFHHYHPDPAFILTAERLDTFIQINPWLQSITSHSLRSFPQTVGGRKACYVTFLRDPTAAFLSLLRYTKRMYHLLSPEVRQRWPKKTPELPLKDLALVYLDQLGGEEASQQTRFFCSGRTMAAIGMGAESDYGHNCYPVARLILENFFMVGVVEHLDKSLRLLDVRLRQVGLELYLRWMRKHNSSRWHSRESWLNPDDPVGSRVLKANESDCLLYNEFRKRLLSAYQAEVAARYPTPSLENTLLSGGDSTPGPEKPLDLWAAERFARTMLAPAD